LATQVSAAVRLIHSDPPRASAFKLAPGPLHWRARAGELIGVDAAQPMERGRLD